MRLFEIAANDTVFSFQKSLKAKYGASGLTDLWLYRIDDSDTIKLGSIIVDRAVQKEGTGTSVMQEITSYADERGFRIILTPGQRDDGHGTTSYGRLVKFYKRFGFKQNKGRNKDFTISAGMIREPR